MDVAFQFPAQNLAHRFVLAHEQYDERVFTSGLRASDGVQAHEVEPHTEKRGPALALLSGVRTPPLALNAWLPGSPFGAMVVRVFWLGPIDAPSSLAASQAELLEQLVASGPPPGPLRLHCSPRSLEGWLGQEQLPPTFQLAVTGASHVLQVAQVGPAAWRHCTHPAAQLYQYGPSLPKRVPEQLCKAAGKLTEALAAAGFAPSAASLAVDVGAAPGGWTAVLAGRCGAVIAIDPADMDPRALRPNVTHLRCKVEDAVEQGLAMVRPLLQLLASGGLAVITLKFHGSGRDKWSYVDAARRALGGGGGEGSGGGGDAPASARGGDAPAGARGAGAGAAAAEGEAESGRSAVGDVRLLWLLANTVNERCIVARRL
eukprot:scaffold23.g4111.t1